MDTEEGKQINARKEVAQKMKVSEEFAKVFRRLTYMVESVETIIGKNLTPIMFWFIVDSIYFSQHNSFQLLQIQRYRELKNIKPHHYDLDPQSEDEMLLRIRKIVAQSKGTNNIHDIKTTSIDQVIQILQLSEQQNKQQVQAKMESLVTSIHQQQEEELKTFNNLGIEKQQSHPMFEYEEFQSQLADQWKQEQLLKATIPKCYACLQPSNLIRCKICFIQVHRQCYPTLCDTRQKENSEEKQFICENCRLQIDEQNQICMICPCVGGCFLQTDVKESSKQIRYNQTNNLQLTNKTVTHLDFSIHQRQENKKKLMHLSCFLWNTECEWNSKRNVVQKTQKIEKKKFTGTCSLCGLSFGAAVPCSNQTCRRMYHAECARRNKLQLTLIKAKTSSVIQLFCGRHRHLKKYEALYESQTSKLKEVRKLYEGIDRELKRLSLSNAFPQIKSIFDKDVCNVCMKEEGSQKIIICKECRRWYHALCGNQCINCHNFN